MSPARSADRICFNGSQWLPSFYGYDGHNNVRYLTDANGQVTDTYDYDAFGSLIARTGTTPNTCLFTGEQYDPDLGLYYLRARYHNPDSGRFWNMDSYEGDNADPSSLHKYTYAANNAVNKIDPTGFDPSLSETILAAKIGLGVASSMFDFWSAGQQLQRGDYSGAGLSIAGGALGLFGSIFLPPGSSSALSGSLSGAGIIASSASIQLLAEAGIVASAGVAGSRVLNIIDLIRIQSSNMSGRGNAGQGQKIMGRVAPPTNAKFGTTTFGQEMHEKISMWFKKNFPNAKFDLRTLTGQNGLDIRVLDGEKEVGFTLGEIKPNTKSGYDTLQRQIANWKNNGTIQSAAKVVGITYNADGTFGIGFTYVP